MLYDIVGHAIVRRCCRRVTPPPCPGADAAARAAKPRGGTALCVQVSEAVAMPVARGELHAGHDAAVLDGEGWGVLAALSPHSGPPC